MSVPFGKYKGQPLSTFYADTRYVEWCRQQPGLVSRYPSVFSTPSRIYDNPTPVHNTLQNLFLDHKYRDKLFKQVSPFKYLEALYNTQMYKEHFRDQRFNLAIPPSKVTFEGKYNWDAHISYHQENNEIVSIKMDDMPDYQDCIKISTNIYHQQIELFEHKITIRERYDLLRQQEYTKYVHQHDNLITTFCRENNLSKENYSWKDTLLFCAPWNTSLLNKLKVHNQQVDNLFHNRNCLLDNCSSPPSCQTPFQLSTALKVELSDTILNSGEWIDSVPIIKDKMIKYINNQSLHIKYFEYKSAILKSVFKDCDITHRYDRIIITLKDIHLLCEIKTLLGDDYPCVLRKMIKQKTEGILILLIKDFNSRAATCEQLIEIFKQSDILVIFFDEIN